MQPLRLLLLPVLLAIGACATPPAPAPPARRSTDLSDLPPMRTFPGAPVSGTARGNADIAQDFLDLSLQLESGRKLPRFTRFEGPISLRVVGAAPASLDPDLARLLARLRTEAHIPIARGPAAEPASVTIEIVPRAELQRAVPAAACFVVPRVTSWRDFLRNRRGGALDWTTLETRERLAVFIPGDAPPQEVRDCLHEELAQALGPLNDLYRLTDSVFNDDNFHTILTGFDMLILRATYAPELHSGMTRAELASALPDALDRLHPAGRDRPPHPRGPTSRAWIDAIERALGPGGSDSARRAAARHAVRLARRAGWNDNRLAFSLFALGRLSLGDDPDTALRAFFESGSIYARDPASRIHTAHIGMQIAAFALSAGQPEAALTVVDANLDTVRSAENAALLSTLLLVKAESLALLGRTREAARVRAEALGWARYGFGDADDIRARAAAIAAIVPSRGPAT